MTAPTKADIKSLGYRISANADDTVVGRCASDVLSAYLLHYVSQAEITAASLTDEIGLAWAALTFLRFLQNDEFATRTGGELKRFEYGDKAEYLDFAKSEAGLKLEDLNSVHPCDGNVRDICRVWFRTQLFN